MTTDVDDDANELSKRAFECDDDVRAWAFECGYSNLKQRIDTGTVLVAQSATTLALLLAGLGAALAYGVRVFESRPGIVAWGAAAVCVWMALLAAVLVAKCVNARPAPLLHTSPTNVLVPGATLRQIQAGELQRLQERIKIQSEVNEARAMWLNRVRYGAVATPLVFALAFLVGCGQLPGAWGAS